MIGYRIWQIAGWTMLHYLWVGAALGAAAIVLRFALRRAAANVRYVAALCGLLMMAAAPAVIAAVVAHRSGAAAERHCAGGHGTSTRRDVSRNPAGDARVPHRAGGTASAAAGR